MNFKLPKGISQAIVSEGNVFLRAEQEAASRGLSLAVGQDIVRFETASNSEVDSTAFVKDIRPNSFVNQIRPKFVANALVRKVEPKGGTLEGLAECWLNELEEWSAANRDTIQLMILDIGAKSTFYLADSIEVPPHEEPYTFRAGIASHRAKARLIVRVVEVGKTEIIEEFDIDGSKPGGTDFANYKIAKFTVASSKNAAKIELALAFDECTAIENEHPPFIFLADPCIGQDVAENDVSVALVLENGASLENPIWLKSKLPIMMQPHQELRLLDGSEVFPLKSGSHAKVTLREDYGHTLMMAASENAVYQFEIDGEPAFHQRLGSDATAVRIPRDFQTGHVRRLTVLDGTGAQVLFSDFIMMPRLLTPLDVLEVESSSPFPGPLMSQAGHRYESLRSQMKAGKTSKEYEQVAYCLSVVEGGHKNVKLKPLTFPQVESPDVTIVIPAHNKVEVTYLGLASLLLAYNDATFEVILVDDASTDETGDIEKIVSGISVVHNKQAKRFIKACNLGASKARGKYVVLLNNDVEVTNGWLDELIAGFSRFDNVGLVGSKLLYPNGKLQDAGGIIWGTGNPWNYGNGKNPWDPRFCYARQADYLSGAAMMTTKKIWDQVGGLSSYLEPMYFEDTDFAFKVREAGFSTWFIPSSIVYHYEGMTSGTDTSTGYKRYQEVNRPKFKRRWSSAYRGFGAEGINPDLEKDRGIVGRVLFIDNGCPRPDRDAGSYAAIQEIKLVQSLGYKVTFLPQNLAHLGSYTDELEKLGVEVIYAPFFLSVENYLEKHARDFDAFFITRFYVARGVMEQLRALAPETKILFNNADLHFLRELRAGIAAGDAKLIDVARQTRSEELAVMHKVDIVLSYNDVEHSVIQSHTDGDVLVAKCPWVVEIPETVPPLKERTGISFLGSYQHTPNAEGILWFTKQVMPLIEAKNSELVLTIYGSGMTDEIKALRTSTIDPQGFVKNLSDAYDKHRIFVAPLLSGAGIKGKVLAALAHGIPCVVTPIAAEGIGLRHGHDCMIATSPNEWRDAINTLQTDDEIWARMSQNAHEYVQRTFSFEVGRGLMRNAFEMVDLFSPVS